MPTRISIDDDNATIRSSASTASGSTHPRPTTFRRNNRSMFGAAAVSSLKSSTSVGSKHESFVSVSAATSKERQDPVSAFLDVDEDDGELRIENLVAESVKESPNHFKIQQRRSNGEGIESSAFSMIDEDDDDQENDGSINKNGEEKFEKNGNDNHDSILAEEHSWVNHEEEEETDYYESTKNTHHDIIGDHDQTSKQSRAGDVKEEERDESDSIHVSSEYRNYWFVFFI